MPTLAERVIEAIRLPNRLMGIEVYLGAEPRGGGIEVRLRWSGINPGTGEPEVSEYRDRFSEHFLRGAWEVKDGPELAAREIESHCRDLVLRCVREVWGAWASVMPDDRNPRRDPGLALLLSGGRPPQPEWIRISDRGPAPTDRAWSKLKEPVRR